MNGYFVRNKLNGKRAAALVEVMSAKGKRCHKPLSLQFFLTIKAAKNHARHLNSFTASKPWRVEPLMLTGGER